MTETELIDKYICQHIEPEGDYLYRLYRATNIHTICLLYTSDAADEL